MEKRYSYSIGFFCIMSFILSGWGFFWYGTQIGAPFYQQALAEKQLRPEYIPSAPLISLLGLGHETTLADFLWLSFIQYIGGVQENTNHIPHSQQLLKTIVTLHPKFTSAYEWALLILPIAQNEHLEYTPDQKKVLSDSLDIAQKGIQATCDTKKITAILSEDIFKKGWKNPNLKNPCKSGMLPYYIGFYAGELGGDRTTSFEQYSIASYQDDVPDIAPIMALLASSEKKDVSTLATKFALLALIAPDTAPFSCRTLSQELFSRLQNPTPLSKKDITPIQQKESRLLPEKEGHQQGIHNCYAMLERAIKYFYLAAITEATLHTNIRTSEELLQKNIVDTIPVTKAQSGMLLKKDTESWEYFLP